MKKYHLRLYKAALDRAQTIRDKYKKPVDANIRIRSNGKANFLNAKVRISGDFRDHLDLANVRSSLKVKIKNGHIGNIRRFRLLLPETRGGSAEIFWSVLMEELGYPVPYRRMVTVNFLGKPYTAIFEESPDKEFLERWAFRESPIVVGDERQTRSTFGLYRQYPNYIGMIVDNKPFLKNPAALGIAYRALFSQQYYGLKAYDKLNAKYAQHGMYIANRRFIFEPIYGVKIPVYSNGNVQLTTSGIDCSSVKRGWSDASHRVQRTYKRFVSDFQSRTGEALGEKRSCIARSILANPDSRPQAALQRVTDMTGLGIGHITDRVITELDEFLPGKAQGFALDNKSGGLPVVFRLKHDSLRFEFCDPGGDNRYKKCTMASFGEAREFIAGDALAYRRGGHDVFPLNVKSSGVKTDSKYTDFAKIPPQTGSASFLVQKNTSLFLRIGGETKDLNVSLEDAHTSRLVLSGEGSDSFRLRVRAPVPVDGTPQLEPRYNDRLLTSCVTFIDSSFDGGTIEVEGGDCEDSLNFIRSHGVIDSIKVRDAAADAVDIDFSKLEVRTIEVRNAVNDCVDLSAGHYNFRKLSATNCGDKGVSIGERARVVINSGLIGDAPTGIAVKDSSIADAADVAFRGTSGACIAAFRKKAEFDGGVFYGARIRCAGKNTVDQFSSVSVAVKDVCLYRSEVHGLEFCLTSHAIKIDPQSCARPAGSRVSARFIADKTALPAAHRERGYVEIEREVPDKDERDRCGFEIKLPLRMDDITAISISELDASENIGTYGRLRFNTDFPAGTF
ncbi:MAG: hypothetical protein ABIJ96_15780 [Elusimicrobiota bacterium]